MTVQFNIASITCSILDGPHLPYWQAFAVPPREQTDFTVHFLSPVPIGHGLLEIPLEIGANRCFQHGKETMLVNRDWTYVQILPVQQSDMAEAFLTQVFDAHAVRRRMLHVHCSMVDYQGCGILFLGPSGIGKTTQAELWRDFRGGCILNGDMGYVQQAEQGFVAWGTPWHGSSPYCENKCVPLKAMVVLKQAPQNTLRELSGFEKVQETSCSVFYPNWVENGVELCLEILDTLLRQVPVYCLYNRADEESVHLLAKELESQHLL